MRTRGRTLLVVALAAATTLPVSFAELPASATAGAPVAAPWTPPAPAVGGVDAAESGQGAGLPSDGTLLPPSRDVQAVMRAQTDSSAARATGPSAVSPPPFSFHRIGYTVKAVPAQFLPYYRASPIPLRDPGVHDGDGVRMVQIGSRLYNHPVAQAQYGLDNLASYNVTRDKRYLDRGIAQAERLVSSKVVSRGAWYYPYPFDFALHGDRSDLERGPWYSAMAQGQALSLFTRLYQATKNEAWLNDALGTARSFINPPAAGLPWTVQVDRTGFLWLQEYPMPPGDTSDFTFNGHMFALFGLFDYARQTRDPAIAKLWDGAVATTRKYGQHGFPNPRWMSNYCLTHKVLDEKYHWTVMGQLLRIHGETGDSIFARLSDGYRDAYPWPKFSSTVMVGPGTRTAYRFDGNGDLLSSRTVTFAQLSNAPSDRYERVKGRDMYFRITDGALAGYLVKEVYGEVFARGVYYGTVYPLARVAIFPAGVASGYGFDSAGNQTGHTNVTLHATSSAPFDQSAMVGGRRYVRITAGLLANRWVPVSGVTTR